MHNIISGKYFKGFNYLSQINESLLLIKRAFPLHQLVESTSVAEFVDKVEVVGGFEHVDILDDVGA